MHIIPVLDLKSGLAVHAVRGERERYAPVAGLLASGGDALSLAVAYRDLLGCRDCYIADLDAIAGERGHSALIHELADLGLNLWVDAGLTTAEAAWSLAELGVARIIVGSESLADVQQLVALAQGFVPERLVLSVDLKGGMLRAPGGIDNPAALVSLGLELGIGHFILLDLARVGASSGPPLDLLAALRQALPRPAYYAGGGVRSLADLQALATSGAAGALIATAFHSGALTARDLHEFASWGLI